MYAKRMWYELKVTFGLTACLPVPALPGFAVLERWLMYPTSVGVLSYVLRDFCLLLPISAALAAAHLMSVEKDEGFAELRASYLEPVGRQIVWRTLIAFFLAGLIFFLGWLSYSWVGQAPVPLALLLPVLPPTMFLLGISLLVNNLSGSYWTAAGTALTIWFLEIYPQTRGQLLGELALFRAVWGGRLPAQTNDMILLGLGVMFILLNGVIGQLIFNRRMAGL